MSWLDILLAGVRYWPLEKAGIDAIPAAGRVARAVEAYFATPQGAKDKLLFEALGTIAAQNMKSAEVALPAEPPAQVGGRANGANRGGLMPADA